MTEIDEVRKAGELVLDALRQHSRSSTDISLVEEPMQALHDPDRRLNAVKVLSGAAHVKCLGDVYLEGMPGFEWPNLVRSLGEVAGRYIKEHDPNAPVGRELGFSQDELVLQAKSLLPTHVHSPPSNEMSQIGIHWPRIVSMWRSPVIRG